MSHPYFYVAAKASYIRLSLLFCIMPLFPYPTSSLPKISPCSPGIRWIAVAWQNRLFGFFRPLLRTKGSDPYCAWMKYVVCLHLYIP